MNGNPPNHLTRREFLAVSAGVVVAAVPAAPLSSGAPSAGTRPANGRPNFLFILTDDQRHDAMGCAGNPHIRTPNLDALAARGMRFRNGFVTLSICSPSRAACLTGNYGSVNGVTVLGAGLSRGQATFAHRLKQQGYRTGQIGKWHIATRPGECGFDASDGRPSGDGERSAPGAGSPPPRIERGGEDAKAARAIQFLRDAAKRDQPFLLWLCTNVPHMPWNPRKETLALYDEGKLPVPGNHTDDLAGKPAYLKTNRNRKNGQAMGYGEGDGIRKQKRQYYAAITDMDTSMGKVLADLDRLGLRDNTYVFWMGDNGWLLGEHGFSSKVLPYEPSIRVPFLVAGPGVRPGSTDDHLVPKQAYSLWRNVRKRA
jgi:arylsulfatase A-like enzyme